MDRRRFLLTALAGTLIALGAAEAQQAEKVWRIGLLGTAASGTPETDRLWQALLEGLRELGYIQGQNLVVDFRSSEGRDDRLYELASELVRRRVDVIVAAATQPVHAARRATIPIVMPNHSDPVGSGVASSLDRPGGNITGLSILNPELTGKRLELLREAVPGLVRVAVLWNPTHRAHPQMLGQIEAAAQTWGLRLHRQPAKGVADYELAFADMAKDRTEAVVVLNKDVPPEKRRVPFKNMIYVGDGLTDIPCFSLIKQLGGTPIGVFDPRHERAAKRALIEFLKPDRVISIHAPKYRRTDELGAMIRAAVALRAGQIGIERKQAEL